MAHALRRISYATCDPEGTQFSFLAREPRGHFSLQYCHSFVTQTPEQVNYILVSILEMKRLVFYSKTSKLINRWKLQRYKLCLKDQFVFHRSIILFV